MGKSEKYTTGLLFSKQQTKYQGYPLNLENEPPEQDTDAVRIGDLLDEVMDKIDKRIARAESEESNENLSD